MHIPYGRKWEVEIGGFQIGPSRTLDNGLDSSFYFDKMKATLDTFNPFIMLPKEAGLTIFSKFLYGVNYTRDN